MEKTRFAKDVDVIGVRLAIDNVLLDPCVHFFTKDTIRRGLNMDPLDAYYDAALATEVLRAHMDDLLKTWADPARGD